MFMSQVESLQTRTTQARLVLVGDIGGSTSRFGIAVPGERPRHVATIANDSMSSFEAAITHYLEGCSIRPVAALLAFAAPIAGDEIALTNRAWRFRLADLKTRFGFTHIRAVNDFEALAWSLRHLAAADLTWLGGRAGAQDGARAVLGPGTGLGVGALVPASGGWQVVPSEGGHVLFGAADDIEEPVFVRMRADAGGSLSAEKVLSGPGLVRLHRALHGSDALATSEAILAAARGGDAASRITAEWFVRLLGRFAGDVALTFKATGGVHIAGGVAFGLGALFDAAVFRQAFENHPPYQKLLGDIPAHLIACPEPGLVGCSAAAEHLMGI
jgi:glucokinase